MLKLVTGDGLPRGADCQYSFRNTPIAGEVAVFIFLGKEELCMFDYEEMLELETVGITDEMFNQQVKDTASAFIYYLF